VAEDHRRGRDVQRGAHRRRRHVREVDEDAVALQVRDDRAADAGQPADARLTGRRVRPRGVVVVGQRHVPDAEPREPAQHAGRRGEAVTALDPEQRRDPAGRDRTLHVVRGVRDREVAGVARDHPMDGVHLLQRRDHRLRLRQVRRHEQRPELRPHAARPQPRQVGVEVRPPGVETVDGVPGPQPQPERQVVVPVDDGESRRTAVTRSSVTGRM
jgi:hypothetical protein